MSKNNRILIVDDNKSVHEDFKKILSQKDSKDDDVVNLEKALFDEEISEQKSNPVYRIDHAFQGEEAIMMIEKSEDENDQYSIVFIDGRMPPGIDGIETISRVWKKFPDLNMVLCTAYSDYSNDEIKAKLGSIDKLKVLQKPFNSDEIRKIALKIIK